MGSYLGRADMVAVWLAGHWGAFRGNPESGGLTGPGHVSVISAAAVCSAAIRPEVWQAVASAA